jgi:hypothetical protein
MSEHATARASLMKTADALDEIGRQLAFLEDAIGALWDDSSAHGFCSLLSSIHRGMNDLSGSIVDAVEVLTPPVPATPTVPPGPCLTAEQRAKGRELLQPAFAYLEEINAQQAVPC